MRRDFGNKARIIRKWKYGGISLIYSIAVRNSELERRLSGLPWSPNVAMTTMEVYSLELGINTPQRRKSSI